MCVRRDSSSELFSSASGSGLPTKQLFRGVSFVLTNVEKSPGQRQEERGLLRPQLDTSTDDSSTEGEPNVPWLLLVYFRT